MNKVIKGILIALLCLFGIVAVLSISVLHITRWKLTDIGTKKEVIIMYDGSEQFDALLKEREITEIITEHEENAESIEENTDERITNFRTIVSQNDELFFSVSLDDYIEAYNSLYQSDHNSDFLADKSQWVQLKQYQNDYSDYESYLYRFQQDTTNYVEPNICVYVPADADYIQAITLNFDDHGYQEWAQKLYVQECLYTFKVLFPAIDSHYLEMMFYELFDMAYSADCFVNDFEKAEPFILFYEGDIGVYPYYSMGMVYICIIPITQDYLADLTLKGSELVEINYKEG